MYQKVKMRHLLESRTRRKGDKRQEGKRSVQVLQNLSNMSLEKREDNN